MDLATLQHELNTRDEGLLRKGSHDPGGREFCALEFESQVRGREWSDDPITLPDIRPLNDGHWESDQARTEALLPLMVALWDWSDWSVARKTEWAKLVAVGTVNKIISQLPGLSNDLREKCTTAKTLQEAEAAASATSYAAASASSYAASAASYAAASASSYAASAAAYAAAASSYAASSILNLSCSLWINAANETKEL